VPLSTSQIDEEVLEDISKKEAIIYYFTKENVYTNNSQYFYRRWIQHSKDVSARCKSSVGRKSQ